MIRRIYEHLLQSRIEKSNLPGCVAVVLGSADLSGKGLSRLCQLLDWSRSIGLSALILYVSDDQPGLCRLPDGFLASYPAQINLHTTEDVVRTGTGGPLKVVSPWAMEERRRWLRLSGASSEAWRRAA
jgi:hypothetical protein